MSRFAWMNHAQHETLPVALPNESARDTAAASLPDGATELVLRYVQDAAQKAVMEALSGRVKGLESELSAAREMVAYLQSVNRHLEESVRQLEIGFRRHVSERVTAAQLGLLEQLQGQVLEAPAPDPGEAESPQAPESPRAHEASGSSGSSSTKKRRHDPHGRRQVEHIPQTIVETLPDEVILRGLAQFDCIGHEDTSLVGKRTGGPVELVFRRLKFVERGQARVPTQAPDPAVVVAEPVPLQTLEPVVVCETPEPVQVAQAPLAAPEAVQTAPVLADAPTAPEVSGVPDVPAAVAVAEVVAAVADATVVADPIAPVAIRAPAVAAVVVREHEVAMAPANTDFRCNPFVDGAFVCYRPASSAACSQGVVHIAQLPERPIVGSQVDASLLAYLLVHKLDYHTPYYRQEVECERLGWPISRGNMARWQFECGKVAARITDAMWTEALERSWIATDATGTAIRAKEQLRYGHVFVLVAEGDAVLYRYTTKNDKATVQGLFGGYTGTVVADASANHNILFGPGKAREAGCWAHGRRPFVKAFRGGEKLAAFAIKSIRKLFRIEEKIAFCTPEMRLEVRQRESAPIVDELFAWVQRELPRAGEHSLVRKGLVYLHNQQAVLQEFLRNGEIPIHNNACERALRRVVKGRRNWLSHGSDEHAQAACALTSLIASCAVHGLDPQFYLQEVLTVAPSYPAKKVLDLAPHNWVATRQRLIAEGSLRYIDLAQVSGSKLRFR